MWWQGPLGGGRDPRGGDTRAAAALRGAEHGAQVLPWAGAVPMPSTGSEEWGEGKERRGQGEEPLPCPAALRQVPRPPRSPPRRHGASRPLASRPYLPARPALAFALSPRDAHSHQEATAEMAGVSLENCAHATRAAPAPPAPAPSLVSILCSPGGADSSNATSCTSSRNNPASELFNCRDDLCLVFKQFLLLVGLEAEP